ncbi:MAG: hemerythrin family protein [Candidatus Aminicenantes bacterium]|nr:hemerythrin family protein [Candidatus Aminicenantes bacterium]
MNKIEWEDSLSVGVNQIDEQHKMLIQKLKDLSDAINEGHEYSKILKTLDFMIDYTDFHFSTEEGTMAENDYPGLDLQKKQHEEFKATLNNILEDYKEEGPTSSLAESINVFLFNWLIKHIKGVDSKLGEFFAEKGIRDIE